MTKWTTFSRSIDDLWQRRYLQTWKTTHTFRMSQKQKTSLFQIKNDRSTYSINLTFSRFSRSTFFLEFPGHSNKLALLFGCHFVPTFASLDGCFDHVLALGLFQQQQEKYNKAVLRPATLATFSAPSTAWPTSFGHHARFLTFLSDLSRLRCLFEIYWFWTIISWPTWNFDNLIQWKELALYLIYIS